MKPAVYFIFLVQFLLWGCGAKQETLSIAT